MRDTVEDMVRVCETCAKGRFHSRDVTHSWPKDELPWSRVHMDWAYKKDIGNILVVADSHSGWL